MKALARRARFACVSGVVVASAVVGARAQEADAPTATTVAAGEHHSCVVDVRGRVVCWGDGRRGQLGGAKVRYVPPRAVDGLPPATQVAATHDRTCALTGEGTVFCWGSTRGPSRSVDVHPPVRVAGLEGITSIALARYLGCARSREGRVLCWGDGEEGGLGDGVRDVHAQARVVASVNGARTIAVGPAHGCAALGDGRVVCWGSNHYGQLGDATGRDAAAPVEVRGVRDVVELAASVHQTCGRTRAGGVVCWGTHRDDLVRGVPRRDPLRALATLLTRRRGTRWSPRGLPPATRIAVSGLNACALDRAGEARCWAAPRSVARIEGVGGARAIALGDAHACVHLADDEVRCWGDNREGQVGDGLVGSLATRPRAVPGLGDAVALQASLGRTCALRRDGEVVCWSGARHHDTRARGSGPGPERILAATRPAFSSFSAGRDVCGRSGSGPLVCVTVDREVDPRRRKSRRIAGAARITRQASTWSATFILSSSGVACVRERETTLRSVAVEGEIVELVASPERACMLARDGRVWCVGADDVRSRQSGSECGAMPREVEALRGARLLAVGGEDGACALLDGGAVRCVGAAFGTDRLLALTGLGDLTALGVGSAHACALRPGGGVVCWGANDRGQLGIGHTHPSRAPTPVEGLDDAVEIVLDDVTTCARRRSGGVVCWGGHDPAAQSSLGSISPTPVRVPL
ncbi:MAG: hypothetical protein IT379_36760 [Deltaproteobacteria bacterium]|nr:hypothetical protein [Deltaproteobacteria bacterium]